MNIEIKNIKFNSFTLVKLNSYNIRHINEIRKLNDFDIRYKYLWNLTNSIKEKNMPGGTSLLIKKYNKYVGYFWISEVYSENKVTCACAIEKKYRGHGIGTEVTKELSDYLLNNCYVDEIALDIDKENIKSKKCAMKAGFTLFETYSDLMVYKKTKRRIL